MDEKPHNDKMIAFSLGALISLMIAGFALIVRRFRRAYLASPDRQPETYADLPASASETRTSTTTARSPVGTGAAPVVPSATGPRWSTPTKYIMGVILFLAALVVLSIGRGVIPMLIFAALLALFINPFIQWINRRLHLKWSAAVGLTYVLVILLLLLIPLLLFPSLFAAVNYLLALDYSQFATQAIQYVTAFEDSIRGNAGLSTLLAPLLESLIQALKNFGAPGVVTPVNTEVTLLSLSQQIAGGLGALANLLGPVIAVVVSAIFTLIMALQMSLASNQMAGWYPDLIPSSYKGEYSALFEKIVRTWISFLRGQITLMIIIGLAVWLGNLALGIPFALLLGIIAGLLELIPNIGPTLAAIPAVVLALFLGSSYLPIDNFLLALLVIGFYVLIQFLENQFIVPRVMGDAVDLPPLIVLIGAIAGATAFGILGALLAAPVIATGNLIFQFIYRKILEPPPLPPELEDKPSAWELFKGWAGRIPLPRRKTTTTGTGVVPGKGVNAGIQRSHLAETPDEKR